RRAGLLFVVAGAQKLVKRTIVFGELELRDIDPLRLLAAELYQLRVTRRGAAEAAVIELKFAFLELLDHVLERCLTERRTKADGVHVLFPERLDLARDRSAP